jgi:hypothetical protein
MHKTYIYSTYMYIIFDTLTSPIIAALYLHHYFISSPLPGYSNLGPVNHLQGPGSCSGQGNIHGFPFARLEGGYH